MKRLWASLFLGVPLGCQASAGGKVNSAGDAEANASFAAMDGEAEGDEARREPTPPALERPVESGPRALLGARHDLFLAEARGESRCRCLAVATGQPLDAHFRWEALVPQIDPNTQMIVAFSSRGQVCEDEPSGSQGASYNGYEMRGADVIVLVEDARPGRPLVNGAIVPRPEPGGRLLFRPVDPALPYGRPTEGSDPHCVVTEERLVAVAPEVEAAFQSADDPMVFEDEAPEPSPDEEERAERRMGLFLGALVGPAYTLARPPDEERGRGQGLGVGFDLLLGGSPSRGLAIGGMLGATITPSPSFQLDGETLEPSDVNMNLVRVAAFVDYAFAGDFHALLHAGFQRLSFAGEEPPLTLTDANGFGLGLGLGHDFWLGNRVSLGVLGRFDYALLDYPGTNGSAFGPLLGLTLTYH